MDFSKYLGEAGLAELWALIMDQFDKRVFVGTKSEYEAISNEIPVGAIVIITDESDVELPPVEDEPEIEEPEIAVTAAILGSALLNTMILGS